MFRFLGRELRPLPRPPVASSTGALDCQGRRQKDQKHTWPCRKGTAQAPQLPIRHSLKASTPLRSASSSNVSSPGCQRVSLLETLKRTRTGIVATGTLPWSAAPVAANDDGQGLGRDTLGRCTTIDQALDDVAHKGGRPTDINIVLCFRQKPCDKCPIDASDAMKVDTKLIAVCRFTVSDMK